MNRTDRIVADMLASIDAPTPEQRAAIRRAAKAANLRRALDTYAEEQRVVALALRHGDAGSARRAQSAARAALHMYPDVLASLEVAGDNV